MFVDTGFRNAVFGILSVFIRVHLWLKLPAVEILK